MAGPGIMSPASTDLGLGGDLQQQVKDETEEERRKRMLAQQTSKMSPGAMSLLGPSMGIADASRGLTSGGY